MKTRRKTVRPSLESLETRVLPASQITLDAGILTIQGTEVDDVVVVSVQNNEVVVTCTGGATGQQRFARDAVQELVFIGLGGADQFFNGTDIRSRIFGGGGNDHLVGGSKRDVIACGAGNDKAFGGKGNDEIRGDSGNDLLRGGKGNDLLIGGLGIDRLFGGGGVNTLIGGTFAVPPRPQPPVLPPDTVAPQVVIQTPIAGNTVRANVFVTGQVTDNSSGVARVQAQIDNGSFFDVFVADDNTFAFPLGLATDGSADGQHRVRMQATDGAGNNSSFVDVTFQVVSPVAVQRISPANGEELVSLTRETVVRFNGPVDPATVTEQSFHLIAKGEEIAGHIRVSPTEEFATFFYDQPLPESTEIRVIVDGDKIMGRNGLLADADGDGVPGGQGTADFRTLPLTLIPGTKVFGYVYDSYNRNPDGSDVPVVGATISLDARPDIFAVTDATGFFELSSAGGLPAPEFFVHIDGSTATNAPAGAVYATLGKPFHSVPGQRTQLNMMGVPFNIYLPPMAMGDVVQLNPTQDTVVGFGSFSQDQVRQLFADDPEKAQLIIDTLKVTYPAGGAMDQDGNPATQATVIPVDPNRLPAPLPPNVKPGLVISVQAGTAEGFNLAGGSTNFDVPAPVSFPNLEGLAPGEKALIWSFDHDAGHWVIIGTGTVTADGKAIVSDEGVGILAPGWHFVISGSPATIMIGGSSASGKMAGDDYAAEDFPSFTPTLFEQSLLFFRRMHSDAQLEAEFRAYLTLLTTGSLGQDMVTRFMGGSRAKFPHPVGSELSNIAQGTDVVMGLFDDVKARIRQDVQTQANGGHITGPNLSTYIVPSPNFTTFDAGLKMKSLIGGTQGTQVFVDNFQATGTIISPEVGGFGSYTGKVRLVICDDFGVDRSDIYAPPLAAFWILQHERLGHRPFVNEITVEMDLSGDFTIPPGFEDIIINGGDFSDFGTGTEEEQVGLADTQAISTVPGFGDDPSVYYRYVLPGGVEVAGKMKPDGPLPTVVLPARSYFTATFYQPSTNRSNVIASVSGPSGETTLLSSAPLSEGEEGSRLDLITFGGMDTDGDGLPDAGEFAIGTNSDNGDSDGDGISDAAEITQGLNPLDNTGFPTGVISSLTMPGNAEAVTVANDRVYVATGDHGLAIVDGAQFNNPILLGQIDLPGNATGVGVDPNLNVAVVATGNTLELVDVSDPMAITIKKSLAIASTHVEVFGGFAYVSTVTSIGVVDLRTGEVIRNVTLPGSGSITGLAREGTKLYAYVSGSDNFVVVDITEPEAAAVVGQVNVSIASSDVGVFAGNGIAWLAGSGLRTVNVSDPTQPTLQHGADNFFNARRITLNGSGLGLLLPDGGNFVQIYNTSNPNDTDALLTQFTLSGSANDVAISRGIAYIAAGGRLEVVNYRPFDNVGLPPQVTISSPATDIDPNTDGLQVLEGTAVPITVVVQDDVQVRDVELLVDGQVVATDVSFPFDFAALALGSDPNATAITVQVRATDTGGNATLSSELTIDLVPDTFAPTIARVEPADGAVRGMGFHNVRVRFSEPIDPAGVTTDNFQLFEAGTNGTLGDADDVAVVLDSIELSDDGTLVQLITPPLAVGSYQLRIRQEAVSDRQGNFMAAGTFLSAFTVAPFVPVTINFDAGDGTPHDYTESGLTVVSAQDHLHMESDDDLLNHSDCCSTPYTFSMVSGEPFSVLNMLVTGGSAIGEGRFTSSSGAVAIPTATGLFTFDPEGWTNITSFSWDQPIGDMTIDDLEIAVAGTTP